MAKKKEQLLWDAFRVAWKKYAPTEMEWERVENACGDGMPDAHGMIKGHGYTWMELKVPKPPKRATTALMGEGEGLRQSQKNWHMKAHSMGCISWILIRALGETQVYLVWGSMADTVNQLTREQLEPYRFDCINEKLLERFKLQ